MRTHRGQPGGAGPYRATTGRHGRRGCPPATSLPIGTRHIGHSHTLSDGVRRARTAITAARRRVAALDGVSITTTSAVETTQPQRIAAWWRWRRHVCAQRRRRRRRIGDQWGAAAVRHGVHTRQLAGGRSTGLRHLWRFAEPSDHRAMWTHILWRLLWRADAVHGVRTQVARLQARCVGWTIGGKVVVARVERAGRTAVGGRALGRGAEGVQREFGEM